MLIVMDGWGEAPSGPSNAISAAHTPNVDRLYETRPHSQLLTSGEEVGLPTGQMGNSEVGHLNIGAGRVVFQELALINKAIREQTIDHNETLQNLLEYCKKNQKPLHLMGLVSDGGVHSHIDHLVALCRIAHQSGVGQILIHAFTDGRDTDPTSGAGYLAELKQRVNGFGATIATVVGRYYAMDRDNRWERIKLAYDLLVHGKGASSTDPVEAVKKSYADGVTDEFIKPIVVQATNGQSHVIREGDAVLCFNFRTDRCREITQVLTQKAMPEFKMKPLGLQYVTMTRYDNTFEFVGVIFEKDNLAHTLGEVVSNAGRSQLRIAETEKYPHVTFFFSGGREEVFPGEERIMIPSPKVPTYDMKPSMSANELTEVLLPVVQSGKYDFICLNFANADMVGHTGVFKAAVEAIETVDHCVGHLVREGLKAGYDFIITADHGNADVMINPDGSPNTAHTTNPVPCFYVSDRNPKLRIQNGRLADLAPTVLYLMGVDRPAEMTGNVLLTSSC
ncbi:MAG: 2,3-bisphosphoglycerate-independent phosphoglycerate mutase [Bacteroidia bacterium]